MLVAGVSQQVEINFLRSRLTIGKLVEHIDLSDFC